MQHATDPIYLTILDDGTMLPYDAENNFIPPPLDGRFDTYLRSSGIYRARETLAAEFMRTKVCSIDQALDDADTALGFLLREGILSL